MYIYILYTYTSISSACEGIKPETSTFDLTLMFYVTSVILCTPIATNGLTLIVVIVIYLDLYICECDCGCTPFEEMRRIREIVFFFFFDSLFTFIVSSIKFVVYQKDLACFLFLNRVRCYECCRETAKGQLLNYWLKKIKYLFAHSHA